MVSRRKRFFHWWRRTGMWLRTSVFILGTAFLALLVYVQRPLEEGTYLKNNLIVFALININLIVLCVFAFLVGRNIVKLVFDRKRNILGSRLRMRLVLAFVGLALIPTAFLYFSASGLLNQAMEGWFSNQVEMTGKASVEIARQHYDSLSRSVQESAARMGDEIKSKPLIYQDENVVRALLEEQRVSQGFFSIQLIDRSSTTLVEARHTIAAIDTFKEPAPNAEALRKALLGKREVLFEEENASQFVRAYNPTQFKGEKAVLCVSLRIDPRLSEAFRTVKDGFREYEQAKFFRNPLRSSYAITLAMITALILFAAIWIGFYVAREISVPIQRLAEGTQAVARGDYDFQIRVSGDDEIAFLVNSFNRMTADLKGSRQDAERRRNFIETILSNLAVGVIALDKNDRVTALNSVAAHLFAVKAGWEGKELKELVGLQHAEDLQALKKGLGADHDQLELQITLLVEGASRNVVCTAGIIKGIDQQYFGSVFIFDDITGLIQAQQMAAWREVARRIAHEIKNPLTPLQLCAQRLQKLLGNSEHSQAVNESTQTIVDHVASIKRLADEFSNFARMPEMEFALHNVNTLVESVIATYAEVRPDLILKFIAGRDLPEINIDREQMRRVLVNLMENAVAALEETSEPQIVITTGYSSSKQNVTIEVADNGPGLSSSDKQKIFEPYFTTKAKGTGLGLAIVTSILSDHKGRVRVFDNKPTGARFQIELPVQQVEENLQRKLSV